MESPHRLSAIAVVTLVSCLAGALRAQAPDSPSFEVASVKRNPSNSGQQINMGLPDRVTMIDVTLGQIINVAYNVPQARIIGGPKWLTTDRFDIIARASTSVPTGQKQLMLRALLADRFKLAVHIEARDETVYELVVLKSGTLGRNLQSASADCATLRGTAQPDDRDPCGTLSLSMAQRTGQMKVRGFDMDELAGILRRDIGTTVVNKTGLSGVFDWELRYTPQAFLQRSFDRERFPSIDPDGPSIFTAVSDQLGLKLQSAKGSVDFLVIDRAEQPTPN